MAINQYHIEILFVNNYNPNIWMIGYKYQDSNNIDQYHVQGIHESAFIRRPVEHSLDTSDINRIIEFLLLQSHPDQDATITDQLEIIHTEKLDLLRDRIKQSQET